MTTENFKIRKFGVIRHLILSNGRREGDYWRNVAEHARTVAYIAKEIGILINLPEDQIQTLELAGWIHDAGKREEVLGIKKGLYPTRADAEKATKAPLVEKYPELIHVTRSTSVFAMEEYYQQGFKGEENLLARILFYADEIVDGTNIVGFRIRIRNWRDKKLLTERRPEYGGATQAGIETQFASEVEKEIREKADLSPNANLIALIAKKVKSV